MMLSDLRRHPAFKGFGRYLLPRDNGTSDYDRPLNQVGSLMPYHEHVDPNIVMGAINHMIDEINNGKTIFYDFYAEHQKRGARPKHLPASFSSGGNRVLRSPLCAREAAFPISFGNNIYLNDVSMVHGECR